MDGKIGNEILLLLRRERYLWHQLRLLEDRQRDIGPKGSPEEILSIITGKGKLLGEIRKAESQLGPIRSNWKKLAIELSDEEQLASDQLDREIQELRSAAKRDTSVMGRLGEWEGGSNFEKAAGVKNTDSHKIVGSIL